MKKDYVILILFLAVTIVAGGMIWVLKPPRQGVPPAAQSRTDESEALRASIKHWESSLATDPDNLDLLVKLGNGYYDINDPLSSIEYYERALTLNPDMPSVLVDCGVMYRQIGQPDSAIALFRKAIEYDPKLPQAYFDLGAVLRMEKDDLRGAAEAWQKYLELTPDPDPRIKEFLISEIDSAFGGGAE